MMKQLKPVHVPKHQVREHRTLVKYRKSLDQRGKRPVGRGHDTLIVSLAFLVSQGSGRGGRDCRRRLRLCGASKRNGRLNPGSQ